MLTISEILIVYKYYYCVLTGLLKSIQVSNCGCMNARVELEVKRRDDDAVLEVGEGRQIRIEY